ncbi:MAG: DUF1501 domain-containing protein [Pseudomonadota bacterium]
MATAASIAGVAGAPKFVFGQDTGQSGPGKTLIKVFLRGGADGLHLFPMVGDINYYNVRPNIAIEGPSNDANSALDMGQTMRAMNPNLAALMEIWEGDGMGHGLTVCPSTAIEEGNRSHFDCQRWIGTGQRNNFIDGYLNRYLQNIDATDHPLRGASLGKTSNAKEISGDLPVPSVRQSSDFVLSNFDLCEGSGCSDNRLTDTMREISSHPVVRDGTEGQVREQQIVLLDAIEEVQNAGSNYEPNAGGLNYSFSTLGRGLRLAAQLIKAGVPLSVASLDWNIGWDTHSNQIAEGADRFTDQTKRYHSRMVEGATDFLCFWRDMADYRDDVLLVAGTEFGRTVKENGSLGTDHGQGGAWFAFGGPARSVVAPDAVNLADENLLSNRYMPNVVDYRDMIGEIMVQHMGIQESMLANLFPTHQFTNYGLFNAGV